jgi:hypothetical protein
MRLNGRLAVLTNLTKSRVFALHDGERKQHCSYMISCCNYLRRSPCHDISVALQAADRSLMTRLNERISALLRN